MGAILGLRLTHVPLLAGRDEHMAHILGRARQDLAYAHRLFHHPLGHAVELRQRGPALAAGGAGGEPG